MNAINGKPQIINSDQGSQYTSLAWTHFLEDNGIKISMDGKGRSTENASIERFWKILKYSHIYLNPTDNGIELLAGVKDYIDYIIEQHFNLSINHRMLGTNNHASTGSMKMKNISLANTTFGPTKEGYYTQTLQFIVVS